MKLLFDKVSYQCSKITTKTYSTSFSLGIKTLDKNLQEPLYNIYGFVRFADEIVDSFHEYDKKVLLNNFINDTYLAIDNKISLNPILNSFQNVVNQYQIDHKLISKFLSSMKKDLNEKNYNQEELNEYILGSAEVVGLMCLKVFVNGEKNKYLELKPYAMRLGSAFQKINFLRDANKDFISLGRTYFPNVNMEQFNDKDKLQIQKDMQDDFSIGLKGIRLLPKSSKSGVYLSYLYFYTLFNKIKKTPANKLLTTRIRVNNYVKTLLYIKCTIKIAFGRI